MLRRTHTVPAGGVASQASEAGTPAELPNLTGDLDTLLSSGPCFPVRVRGYDRLQVDNYVAWAESELISAKRQNDHLLTRYGACSAELELSRRLLAQAPKGSRDLSPVSDRVAEILRLAADEATDMLDAAGAEADQVRADARLEADARLRKAHEIKEAAVAACDQLRELARHDRAEATSILATARAEADTLLRGAGGERDRLARESEEARACLAELQAELADLRHQRDQAEQSLHLLTDRIEQALQAVAGSTTEPFVVAGNRVQTLP